MVRTPAHALTRSTGFALLKPTSRPQLDSARIVTLSGTIALNLLAMGLLMMPLSLPIPSVTIDEKPGTELREVVRDPPVVDVVPIDRPKPPTPVAPTIERRSVAPTHSDTTVAAVISETGTEVATESTSETAGPAESFDIVEAAPSAMQLQYKLAPAPTYPRRAQQQRLTGTVLLQVLVGIDGRPLEVKVAQSSGHRELDEAARAQVLKRWSFQPATKDGLAVRAIGMVPIEFALRH
jgi:protein TonB